MGIERELIDQAAALLGRARLVVVLTGAGISKESGVPTFRDAMDSLWARYDPQQLATPGAFRRDPTLVWNWYTHRRELLRRAAPNPGHGALAQLESLVPQMVVITQNVDGLHQAAGSSDVIELHGNLSRDKCFAACQGEPTYVAPESALPPVGDMPPRCPHCEGYIRPDVVWFGEALPQAALARAVALSRGADVMLVVGTSGVVQPAASLPYYAAQSGKLIVDVNPFPDEISPMADVFLQGPAGEVLPRLVETVRTLREGRPVDTRGDVPGE